MADILHWFSVRLPHVEFYDARGLRCWRLYGIFRPYKGFAIIDWTVTTLYAGKPEYRRLRILGLTVYERNRQFSGLPNG